MTLRDPRRLRSLMQLHHVTLRELAGVAGYSGHNMIAELRKGSRRSVNEGAAHAIAARLGVEVTELFDL